MNTFIQPMLAETMNAAQISTWSEWAIEEKFDGHRVVVAVTASNVVAWSRMRAGKMSTKNLPLHIVDALRSSCAEGIYDGELMVPNGRSYDVVRGTNAGREVFVVFDMLTCGETSLVQVSYDDRRTVLAAALSHCDSPHVRIAESRVLTCEADVVTFVHAVWDRDGEGAILKRRASRYQSGKRSADWIKIKQVHHATVTVKGYEVGKMGPHSSIIVHDDDGHATTVKTPTNAVRVAIDRDPQSFLERRMVIEYHERTPSGSYRHPRFDRWENE